jgi:hypothetical protein
MLVETGKLPLCRHSSDVHQFHSTVRTKSITNECRVWTGISQSSSGSLQTASAPARACCLHDSGQQGNECWSRHLRLAATIDT